MKPIVATAVAHYQPSSMLNDHSSILSLLRTRRSAKPRDLRGPGPAPHELEEMLTIAARTPDHGKLTPWRFITVSTDQRDALADLLLKALANENPDATPAHRDKEVSFAHYPGQLVVLVSSPVPDHKIPVWEQELSCGAAGMNLLLAAHAMGYVAGWVTGWRAYSAHVREAFCGPEDRIAGFIFIGHSAFNVEERDRPQLQSIWKAWKPSA